MLMNRHVPIGPRAEFQLGKWALFALTLYMTAVRVDAADSIELFRTRVAPILGARCVSCHNSLDQKGSFSLQTQKEVVDSGLISAGKPAESHFLSVLLPQSGKRPSMPKSGEPLKPKRSMRSGNGSRPEPSGPQG